MTEEDRAAAIVQKARAERGGSSRAMWIVALVIGAACAVAFTIMMFGDGPSSSAPQRTIEDRGLGFGAGVLVGVVVGVAVGFAVARQRQSSRNNP